MSLAQTPRLEKYTTSKTDNFKPAFDALAVNGVIGDPQGIAAFAYIRVSSDMQNDEGKDGLPRQIRHIHEIALEKHYCIAWPMVFADDASGFEYENRPALTALRTEFKKPDRRASVVIIEHLDRLSRHADWHQGFLLDEMKKNGIDPVFWKGFNSRIEQAVMGAVSQEGMERQLQAMAEARRAKARKGRVTVSLPAFGYRFVDSQGQTDPRRVKRDTHYGIDETEAAIVRLMFEGIAYGGKSIRGLALELQSKGIKSRRGGAWCPSTIREMLKNPVYKGEFISQRFEKVKHAPKHNGDPKPKDPSHRVERSPDEWVIVPVPPIVSVETWETVQDRLKKNRETKSGRNDQKYMLTGLVVCAKCGMRYCGQGRRSSSGVAYYVCNSYTAFKRERCDQPGIRAQILESAIWGVLCDTLVQPENIIRSLEQRLHSDHNQQIVTLINYLTAKIEEETAKDEKDYRAYLAGGFDEFEFAEKHRARKATIKQLESEIAIQRAQLITVEGVEAEKARLLALSQQARKAKLDKMPDSDKRSVLVTLVDRIVLDTVARTFRIEGAIPSIFNLDGKRLDVELCNPSSPIRRTEQNERLTIPFAAQYSLKSNALLSVDYLENTSHPE